MDIPKSRSIRRIVVEGYETLPPHDDLDTAHDDLDTALREHFSSCGEMVHVYIPRIGRFALIYLRGEGAEEKALELSGSYMGGRKLVVKAYPFEETYLDTELAPMRAADQWRQRVVGVTGYDTSLPQDVVSSRLSEHFSSCVEVVVFPDLSSGVGLHRKALLFFKGEDATEKALKVSGSDVGGWKIVVATVAEPPNKIRKHPNMWGYTPPGLLPKKANMSTEKKMSIYEEEEEDFDEEEEEDFDD